MKTVIWLGSISIWVMRLANQLGMAVEFKPIDWNAKEIELEAGTIDCVWNGMSITPEREENMALSNKYLNNKIVLMTLADSDLDVTEASQLADLNIGTQVDSSALQMLQSQRSIRFVQGTTSASMTLMIRQSWI